MTKTLTGKTRFVIVYRWFRKPLVVIQVEERKRGQNFYYDPHGTDIEPYDYTYWRNATPEDIFDLKCGGIFHISIGDTDAKN
jgi:hypothetical protein